MELVKYDRGKNAENGGITIINNNGTSGGDAGTRVPTGGRTIWGQQDSGDDIDGSMVVNGNVTIKAIEPPAYEPDDEPTDGEDEEEETGGGNLTVELKVTGNQIEGNETYGKKLFVNYPTVTDAKSNVADLIKKNADGIKKNTDQIKKNADAIAANKTSISNLSTTVSNLSSTVSSHTAAINTNAADITALQLVVDGLTTATDGNTADLSSYATAIAANTANIATNASNISTNASNIATLEDNMLTEARVKELINELMPKVNTNGGNDNPVILFSGQIRRSAASKDVFNIEGYKNSNISIIIHSVKDGLMTLKLTGPSTIDDYIYVGAVNVTQAAAGDTDNITSTSLKGRGDGAHWFESRFSVAKNETTVYIREFHCGNDNNDTWLSDNWKGDGGIKQVNVMISGYYYPYQ